MRRIRIGLLLRVLSWVLVVALLLAFPYGPLFPWSPVTPGYERVRSARADVLYPWGSVPEGEWWRRVDENIREAERFHRLSMPRRVTVVQCATWSDFQRFMPHIRSRGPGAVALWTGTVVYLTPKLREKNFDHGEYVRHELAHAAVHQNQSLVQAMAVGSQPWLFEGIAVSFGDQKSYVTPEQFVERAMREDLGPVVDPGQRSRTPQPADMRFSYQAWRYFLEHLIEKHGRERFTRYFADCVAQPANAQALFATAYGQTLRDAIGRFQSEVREGKWRPDPEFVETETSPADPSRPRVEN